MEPLTAKEEENMDAFIIEFTEWLEEQSRKRGDTPRQLYRQLLFDLDAESSLLGPDDDDDESGDE
jgi:hypothetical protein